MQPVRRPGTGEAEQIGAFCQRNYGVTFPLFDKIDVNGDQTHPLFRWLKSEARGALGSSRIKWNFTKFLVGRDGAVLDRFGSSTEPAALTGAIEEALSGPAAA